MSIVGNLRSFQDGDIDAVLARPERAKRLLYDDALGQDDGDRPTTNYARSCVAQQTTATAIVYLD